MQSTTFFTRNVRILAPVVLGVVVLIVWQLATSSGLVPTRFLPSPIDIAGRFFTMFTSPRFLGNAGVTLSEALLGSLIAVCIAVPLGYLVARRPLIDMSASPYIAASQAVPAIALAPLLVIWLGYGLFPIAILCALTAFFPMLITTVLGVRQLPHDVLEAARLDGANEWQTLWWVEAPLALPSVLAGIRGGVTLSITGAVVGEFTMGGDGLGSLLTQFQRSADTTGMFATLAMLVLLAVTMFTVLRLVELWISVRRPKAPDVITEDDVDVVLPPAPTERLPK